MPGVKACRKLLVRQVVTQEAARDPGVEWRCVELGGNGDWRGGVDVRQREGFATNEFAMTVPMPAQEQLEHATPTSPHAPPTTQN